MRILLIAPSNQKETFWDLFGLQRLVGRKALGLPLALPTLAALTPAKHEVMIVNEYVQDIDFGKPADFVGISFCTHLALRAYHIADEFRRRGVKVVLGGIHASSFPEEALKHADCVLVGEAEDLWCKVLDDLEQGKLQLLYEQKEFVDLADRPIPRWDLINHEDYYCFNVQIGRGCPHHCEFCIVHCFFGGTYRHKRIVNIIEEIQYLQGIDGRKPIFFCDDNILSNSAFSRDLFQALIPLGIQWWCQASMDKLKDEEMLALMYRSGCRMIIIGFESVSQESLTLMGKEKINIAQEYKKTVSAIYRHGIGIIGFFLVGADSDKKESFLHLERFIEASNIAFVMLNILMPFPKTAFRDKMLEQKRIIETDWSQYTMEGTAFQLKNFTGEEIVGLRRAFLAKIYSSENLYRRLCHAWEQGAFIGKRRKVLTKGRLLFTLIIFTRLFPDIKRIIFAFKCLWRKEAPSMMSVALAINFYDYARDFFCERSKKAL